MELYERVIKASSNPEDIVLDPFAGCATTLIVAEKLGQKWVGMDMWKNSHEVVLDRLEKEGLISKGRTKTGTHLGIIFPKGLTFTSEPPERTDDNEDGAVPLIKTARKRKYQVEPWQKLSRSEITGHLEEAQNRNDNLVICAGCGREMEALFMELDHIQPRSERGENDISNRILLCRLCNGKKATV